MDTCGERQWVKAMPMWQGQIRTMTDIQVYSFEIELDGHRFAGEIPAKSEAMVKELIPTATAIELLEDTYDYAEMLLMHNNTGVIH